MDTTTNNSELKVLNIREYADLKGLGISTVRKQIKNEKLDCFKNDDGIWLIRCYANDIPEVNTDATTLLLLQEKDKQIQDLKSQVSFLQETLNQKADSEERLQQIILAQSVPKLGV